MSAPSSARSAQRPSARRGSCGGDLAFGPYRTGEQTLTRELLFTER